MGSRGIGDHELSRRKVLLGILAGTAAQAQTSSFESAGKAIEIGLTAITRATVRITVQPVENGIIRPVPVTGALLGKGWSQLVARIRTLPAPRNITCGDLTVKLSNNPLTIRVEANAGRLVQELKVDPATGNVSFPLSDSHVFGLGQGGPQFDRKGQLDRMGSGQAGYRLGTHGAKVPVPLAIGTSGWALFIHQPAGAFDLTGADGVFKPVSPETSLPLDVFVISATEPAAVLSEYAKITGLPEMPPLWALGYQLIAPHAGAAREEILQEAGMFREKKLPCDAMIYLGTGFCPNGWNRDNGEFGWNEKAFPDPKTAIDGLHKENFMRLFFVALLLEGVPSHGRRQRPLHDSPAALWPRYRWPLAAGSSNQLLLAGSQAPFRLRCGWLVARPG